LLKRGHHLFASDAEVDPERAPEIKLTTCMSENKKSCLEDMMLAARSLGYATSDFNEGDLARAEEAIGHVMVFLTDAKSKLAALKAAKSTQPAK
jgi:hypothetical protein